MNTRPSFRTVAGLLAMIALLGPATTQAASTSPGKNSAYESFTGALPAEDAPSVLATATIAKGKSKRVLEATATISITSVSTTIGFDVSGRLLANGVAMEGIASPGFAAIPGLHGTSCYGDALGTQVQGCVLTITGWLNLDAAELSNPGVFLGEPINVELSGGAFDAFDGNVNGNVTLSVRMEKK